MQIQKKKNHKRKLCSFLLRNMATVSETLLDWNELN